MGTRPYRAPVDDGHDGRGRTPRDLAGSSSIVELLPLWRALSTPSAALQEPAWWLHERRVALEHAWSRTTRFIPREPLRMLGEASLWGSPVSHTASYALMQLLPPPPRRLTRRAGPPHPGRPAGCRRSSRSRDSRTSSRPGSSSPHLHADGARPADAGSADARPGRAALPGHVAERHVRPTRPSLGHSSDIHKTQHSKCSLSVVMCT